MHRILHILILSLLCCLAACSDDILTDAASQPTCVLNDSDSFNLGVLLTGHSTATQKLMIHNYNDGEIVLESIRLRGGDSSIFRINVDGMAGTSFTNSDFLHIARGDSLYVLVEASFSGRQAERDVRRTDYVDIQCNGQLRSVLLSVITRDVEEIHADTLRCDTIWQEGEIDKLLYGSLVIPEGVTFTIGPGVTLYLHDGAGIEVYGSLHIEGTQQKPVQLIGDRTDKIFDNLYYRDMSAQWDGIHIHPGSTGNLLEYAEVRGMTTGITLRQDSTWTGFLREPHEGQTPADDPKRYAYGPDFLSDEHQQLIIRHSLIMNSDSSLIHAINGNMIVENSCLMNSAGALLELSGGAYDITHCTLANYNFWATFRLADVVMRNYRIQPDTTAREPKVTIEYRHLSTPLYRCNLTNSIIYGNSGMDPNVKADYYHAKDFPSDSIFNYRLDHCLLHSTTGQDDDDCLSILWTEEPLYELIDLPNYTVDPHLQSESPCIGKAEPRTLERLPLDRDGKARPATPALGCYEP